MAVPGDEHIFRGQHATEHGASSTGHPPPRPLPCPPPPELQFAHVTCIRVIRVMHVMHRPPLPMCPFPSMASHARRMMSPSPQIERFPCSNHPALEGRG